MLSSYSAIRKATKQKNLGFLKNLNKYCWCVIARAAAGTRVINYPGNFLLPDGYPGSEYLICRIYLIDFSELVQ